MTVASGRTQAAAVIALLESAGLAVGDGTATGITASKYAVVYADLGVPDGTLGDPFADLDQTVFVHGCGTTAEQAQWVADKARTALLGASLTITGRATLWITHNHSQPVQRDDQIMPGVFYTVDQYTVQTTPV